MRSEKKKEVKKEEAVFHLNDIAKILKLLKRVQNQNS